MTMTARRTFFHQFGIFGFSGLRPFCSNSMPLGMKGEMRLAVKAQMMQSGWRSPRRPAIMCGSSFSPW